MSTAQNLPTELMLLGWSIVLLLGHMAIQGVTNLRERGIAFNAGPRDDPAPLGPIAGRAQRTLDNFKETYPVFIALALGLAVTGRGGGIAETGAWMWFLARIVYVPLYLFGIPWLRSACWLVSALGLTLKLVRFL